MLAPALPALLTVADAGRTLVHSGKTEALVRVSTVGLRAAPAAGVRGSPAAGSEFLRAVFLRFCGDRPPLQTPSIGPVKERDVQVSQRDSVKQAKAPTGYRYHVTRGGSPCALVSCHSQLFAGAVSLDPLTPQPLSPKGARGELV